MRRNYKLCPGRTSSSEQILLMHHLRSSAPIRRSLLITRRSLWPKNRSFTPICDTQINYNPKHGSAAAQYSPIGVWDEASASNKLISSYVRAGDLESALTVFNEVPIKSTVTWNSILAWYAKRSGRLRDAQELFDRIPEPNVVSYNTMLACVLRESGVEAAIAFFRKMMVRDVASWNTMISGLARDGRMEEACEMFKGMPEKNSVSWSAMITGYVEVGDLVNAEKCFFVAPRSVVAWTAMITGYMKFGKVEFAERLFENMEVKNLVTWNAMLAGYVENGRANEALKLFKVMVEMGIRLNDVSFCSVLLGISNLSALLLGKQVHQLIKKSPVSHDINSGTSLISMYCKCGALDDAWRLFLEMPKKDMVTWNSMISGYAQHGAGMEALSLFDKMKEDGIKPNWITFVAVISACNHVGLVDEGFQHFNSMKTVYGMNPKPDHYTCMVDLFGRAGMLVEAVDLVRTMPFPPHAPLFGTLLSACRVHKNLELAEYASENLLRLDPSNAAGYVQLANAYASEKRWDHVARVRRLMESREVVKPVGYSWLEVDKEVHEFRSSDRLHPEQDAILEKLSALEKKMKLAGYVPNFEFALHDVGDELKEQILLRHSEKLAVAFGLIRTAPGTTIRVFKNLRICGDCHTVINYISEIEGREIIVRDTTRFHHFRNGTCSCRDYW